METKKVELKLNSGTLVLETGKMAKQANGFSLCLLRGFIGPRHRMCRQTA